MKLATLLQALESYELARAGTTATAVEALDIDIQKLAYHTNQIGPQTLFFAWKGERHDGSEYVPLALKSGAVAVVSDRETSTQGAPLILVSNVRAALSRIAAEFHNHPSRRLKMIGVTGTNGKTSTAFLIHDLLNQSGLKAGLVGTVLCDNGSGCQPAERTTPEGLDLQAKLAEMVQHGCQACVMEVTSHALDQGRVEGIEYDAAVFTNLTPDHLDYHGTMEAYLAAKGRLFGKIRSEGVAILNADDPASQVFRTQLPKSARLLTYGIQKQADFKAEEIECTADGTRFTLHASGGCFNVQMRWLGEFNVTNTLAATATAHAFGLSLSQIVARFAHQPFVPGRMERVSGKAPFSVLVDYAHTEDALRQALRTLRPLTRRKLILVIGCGGNRDKSKRSGMALAACELADSVFFTSDNPRFEHTTDILRDMTAGVAKHSNYKMLEDRTDAIRQAIEGAEAGDMVLIAGKGHESTQEISGVKYPFSDQTVARQALQEVARS